MSEAHTQNRKFSRQALNKFDRDSSFFRCAGARRNYDPLWFALDDLFHRNFVVAMYLDVTTQFAQKLRQVVGERIVVVEQQNQDVPLAQFSGGVPRFPGQSAARATC